MASRFIISAERGGRGVGKIHLVTELAMVDTAAQVVASWNMRLSSHGSKRRHEPKVRL
jgi:hypothetical protein